MPLLIPYRLLLLLLVLGGLAFGLDRLIETDEEAIEALVDRATRAAREGDFQAVGETLDVEYQGKGGSRDGVLKLVQSLWETWKPADLGTELGDIQVEGETAKAPVRVKGQVLGRPLALQLETHYVKRDAGWRVAGAQVVGWGELISLPR